VRNLPPLKALRAFEAAARRESFTAAGTELNVTQTAISHQIKGLEQWIGFPLFRRLNNKLVLTERGAAFLPVVRDSFLAIAHSVERLSGRADSNLLSIGARPNFATRWLVPRLPGFAALHPEVEIQLFTSFRFQDLMAQDFDAAIEAAAPDGSAGGDLLFTGEVFPVCAPAYRDAHRLAMPADLAHTTRLHMLTAMQDWPLWLAAAGVDQAGFTSAGPKFDSYALTREAAVAGWGVALARTPFVADDLAAGRLVAPFDIRPNLGRGWYFVALKPAKPAVQVFRAWILAEVAGRA
jgi:LysR family transcriptional regulator, glycine cleavage system transcriptional activator